MGKNPPSHDCEYPDELGPAVSPEWRALRPFGFDGRIGTMNVRLENEPRQAPGFQRVPKPRRASHAAIGGLGPCAS